LEVIFHVCGIFLRFGRWLIKQPGRASPQNPRLRKTSRSALAAAISVLILMLLVWTVFRSS